MPAASAFDPTRFPPHTVIRVRIRFDGDPEEQYKLLVVLFHDGGFAVCAKATSKVERYRDNPERVAGVAFIPANEVSCFTRETAIQVDNLFPVPHASLHPSCIVGCVPAARQLEIVEAVRTSIVLPEGRKRRILRALEG